MNWHICHKKLLFCSYFRHISLCFYSNFIGRAHWMCNLIPHPKSTHIAYFWWTALPQKQEIPEKMWWWCHHHIFQVFLVFGVEGSIKSMQCGYSLDAESNSHPTSSPDRNLSKNTGRYVENTNTKSSFFLSSSKINQYYFIILTIILLF